MFMEYVPDYVAFKKLAFKGADSYICKASPEPSLCLFSLAVLMQLNMGRAS